jgi:hypothetical protein
MVDFVRKRGCQILLSYSGMATNTFLILYMEKI